VPPLLPQMPPRQEPPSPAAPCLAGWQLPHGTEPHGWKLQCLGGTTLPRLLRQEPLLSWH
jgi:hypothetical protein